MTDDEPKTRARRVTGWADIPAMEPPHPTNREFAGLAAIGAILDHLNADERRRVLTYITDRYALGVSGLPAVPPPWDGD